MPSFDIIIQGKSYRVEIPNPGAMPLQVIVDGQPFDVTIAGAGIAAAPAAPLAEARPPAAQPTPLPPPLSPAAVPQPAAPISAADGVQISAPMPGTILTVEVEAGQTVESGQVVCVLEAMKMKNPIRANTAGVVAEVAVRAGQTVAYGDLLIRLA
ncbi:MAG: Glutaconyl-CoA decarboxylase subunit gamma [Chloroflexi bacterium ADurb.Bin325]|nr:MAG: Glutaconyl-CoA decarboxylase subunit gamma [Chloroflexi bacterium ADurb.Bin325]